MFGDVFFHHRGIHDIVEDHLSSLVPMWPRYTDTVNLTFDAEKLKVALLFEVFGHHIPT